MQVFINDQEIEVSTQDERNAGDVVRGIHSWLGQEGFGAARISLNGSNILHQPLWTTVPLESIHRIDVSAFPLKELRTRSLSTLSAWTSAMHEVLEALGRGESSVSPFLNVLGQYPLIEDPLAFLTEYDPAPVRMFEPALRTSLDAHVADCTLDDGSFNPGILPSFATTVWHLNSLCAERRREYEAPLDEVRKAALASKELLADLSTVGVLLQTGKETEAYNKILAFSELLAKVIRLFYFMREAGMHTGDMSEWNAKASACLDGIHEAMGSMDTVALGDMLEYELPEVVDDLLAKIPGGS